jgi:hypothetical protein
MGASMSAIMQAAGTVGNTIGAVGDLAGAFVQRKEAKRQKEAGAAFAAQQKLDFGQTYSDLFSLLGGQATYKRRYFAIPKGRARSEKAANNGR